MLDRGMLVSLLDLPAPYHAFRKVMIPPNCPALMLLMGLGISSNIARGRLSGNRETGSKTDLVHRLVAGRKRRSIRYVLMVGRTDLQTDRIKAKESVFAKFAKNYSELKLVKHEKKMVGLDGRDRRRIDVLGWKI